MENLESKNGGLEIRTEEMEKERKKKQERLEDFTNAIYQNIQTAIQSIEELLKVCTDEKFCLELKREMAEYVQIKTKLFESKCVSVATKIFNGVPSFSIIG